MKHRLLTLAACLCLLLGLGSIIMWARSGWVGDSVWYSWTRGYRFSCSSVAGSLRLAAEHRENIVSGDDDWGAFGVWYEGWTQQRATWDWNLPTTSTRSVLIHDTTRHVATEVRLPYWLLTLTTACLSTVWFSKRRKERHRRTEGLCRVCGYDLRASPERCPECGTPISQLRDTGTNAG